MMLNAAQRSLSFLLQTLKLLSLRLGLLRLLLLLLVPSMPLCCMWSPCHVLPFLPLATSAAVNMPSPKAHATHRY